MFYPRTPFLKHPEIESQLFKGNQKSIETLCEWLCSPPKSTTYRINLLKTNPDAARNKIKNEILKKYRNPPEIRTIANIPELISISNLSNSENPTITPSNELNEIIVDVSCGASILRGAHVYGPGVMAMRSGTKLGERVNVYADIEGRCKKGTNTVYESAMKTFLGVGDVRMIRYQLFGEKVDPRGIAIEMHQTISDVPSIGDLSSSELLLQNFPSIVCVRVLDPQPGETILDMCSAPGNKTTHIAELMKDTGTLIALDKTESKIGLVKDKISRRDLNCVRCFAFDSTKSLDKGRTDATVIEGPPFAPESFDRILLDAPCSALGNRPLVRCDMSVKMLESYSKVQKKLFQAGVGLLKRGGVLVYSTCTVTESENEGVVRWALDKFTEIELVKSNPIFGSFGLMSSELTEVERELVQRFGPNDTDNECDSVGFFIAKFCKKL